MKKGWEKKTLKELSTRIGDGLHGTPSYDENGEYFFINGNNLNDGKIEIKENTKRVNYEEYLKNKKELTNNTILVSINGTLGNVAFYNQEPIILGKSACYINLKENVNRSFIKFLVKSPLFYENMAKESTGATIKNFSLKSMREFNVNLPPLTEQKQIVAKLDKAFAAIDKAEANTKQNIANAKELFQSRLDEIFTNGANSKGWVTEKLGELGTLTSSKRIFKNEYVNVGIPFYRSKEIKELGNNREISLKLFISEKRYNEIKEKFGIPSKGDILLTAVGTIGEMYIVEENDKFYFKDGNIMWLKNFTTLNQYFLKYALTNYVEQLKSLSRGSAYNALTISTLNQYIIPVPDNKDQEKIVEELDKLREATDKLVANYEQKLSDMAELRKSLLEQAFLGNLS